MNIGHERFPFVFRCADIENTKATIYLIPHAVKLSTNLKLDLTLGSNTESLTFKESWADPRSLVVWVNTNTNPGVLKPGADWTFEFEVKDPTYLDLDKIDDLCVLVTYELKSMP